MTIPHYTITTLAFVEVDASLVSTAPPSTGPGAGSGSGSAARSGLGSAAGTVPPKKKKVPLNGGDRLFGELRDLNFSVVGGLLHKVARRINADYEERHNAKTMPQIREFVSKMGGLAAEHQSLRLRRLLLCWDTGIQEISWLAAELFLTATCPFWKTFDAME